MEQIQLQSGDQHTQSNNGSDKDSETERLTPFLMYVTNLSIFVNNLKKSTLYIKLYLFQFL